MIDGAIVVTRYVNQLKKEGTGRTTNSSLLPNRIYVPLAGAEIYEEEISLTPTHYARGGGDEFNPYLEQGDVNREDDITAVKPSK